MDGFRQTYRVDRKKRDAALEKLRLSVLANEPDATEDLPDGPSDHESVVVVTFFGRRPSLADGVNSARATPRESGGTGGGEGARRWAGEGARHRSRV